MAIFASDVGGFQHIVFVKIIFFVHDGFAHGFLVSVKELWLHSNLGLMDWRFMDVVGYIL